MTRTRQSKLAVRRGYWQGLAAGPASQPTVLTSEPTGTWDWAAGSQAGYERGGYILCVFSRTIHVSQPLAGGAARARDEPESQKRVRDGPERSQSRVRDGSHSSSGGGLSGDLCSASNLLLPSGLPAAGEHGRAERGCYSSFHHHRRRCGQLESIRPSCPSNSTGINWKRTTERMRLERRQGDARSSLGYLGSSTRAGGRGVACTYIH